MHSVLKAVLLYCAGAGLVTAGVQSFARALCFPPYWPAEYVFRCRPARGYGAALLWAVPGAALSALMIAAASLPVAVLLILGIRILQRRVQRAVLQGASALVGGGAWIWLMRELEPSFLDFKVGWYATGAGAAVAAFAAWNAARQST
jgi:hypothetical protein